MENNFNDDSHPPLFSDEKSFQDFEFDGSYSDFTDSGALTNEVSSINVEEYAFQELDLDSKYRSIQAVDPILQQSVFSMAPPQLFSKAPPMAASSNLSTLNTAHQLLTKAPQVVVTTKPPVSVPDEPLYVAVTQFVSDYDIETIISMIEHELNNILEVSYEFYHQKCRWEGVYLCGPSRCKFEFNIYKNDSGSYIIEANRICGDNFCFGTMFRGIRDKFSSSCSSPTSVMNFQHIPLPETDIELSSSEIVAAITPILSMAASGLCESQVNAAQIFCDLSMQPNMVQVLCEQDCVKALVKLVRVEFGYCNQHAVCALANLSSSRSCQEILLKDEAFLQQLLQLCSNGSYNTAEMRRECARLLANLCSAKTSAMKVLRVVGADDVSSWMDTVDDLKDERLRLHAERAKNALHPCMA